MLKCKEKEKKEMDVKELKQFIVTFRYSESVWCTNICSAENIEAVAKAYSSEYGQKLYIREASESDIYEATAKNMPHTVIINGKIA